MKPSTASLLLALLLLAGCAASVALPQTDITPHLGLPRRLLVTQIQGDAAFYPQWQVVIQQQGAALRFLRFDLFGVPDARQLLQNGNWQNDGFIAPNAKARELFAALLFAFTDAADLPFAYRQSHLTFHKGMQQKRELKKNRRLVWTVTWEDGTGQPTVFFIKNHANGIVWQVRSLDK